MRRGQHVTDEQRAKMSAAHVGQKVSPETRAKLSVAAMGRIMSPETRAKLSAANLGKIVSPETRGKLSAANMGNKYSLGHITSPETRGKLSATMMGPLHWRWRGGRKVSGLRHVAKRRSLGFNPLNSWFIGCEGHHINKDDVIYEPKQLHRSVPHDVWTGRGMVEANALAGQYLMEYWT